MPRHGLVHTERQRDDLVHLLSFEWIELAHSETAEAQQGLLGAAQRGVRIPLSLVVRPEENYFLARNLSRHKMQQLERRSVSPLKILEYDKEWLFRRESSEKL